MVLNQGINPKNTTQNPWLIPACFIPKRTPCSSPMPPPTIHDILRADTTKNPSRNINDEGCAFRSSAATHLLLSALLLSILLKATPLVLPRSTQLSSKCLFFPVSILIAAAVASWLEAELQVCVVVTYLDASSSSSIERLKTFVILSISFLSSILSYVLLARNESGRWCPFLSKSWSSSVWCYVPNLLGYFRLLLLLVGLFFFRSSPVIFVSCWLSSCCLDFFDGYF